MNDVLGGTGTNMFNFSSAVRLIGQVYELEQKLHTALATKSMISGVLVYEKPFLPPLQTCARIVGLSYLMTGSADGFGIVGALIPNPAARVSLTKDELRAVVRIIAGERAQVCGGMA